MSTTLKTLQNWGSLITSGFAVIAFAWAIYTRLVTTAEGIVTRADLAEHDADRKAHAYLLGLHSQCVGRSQKLEDALRTQHDSDVEVAAHLVRTIGADRAHRAAERAMMAGRAEAAYRAAIRRGYSIEDAMLEALRAPPPR